MTLFIRYLRLHGVVLLVLAAAAVRADQDATILVLGDSISAAYGIEPEQGWVKLLEKRLAERSATVRVVNASVSGETTGGGLARLPDALSRNRPDVVIIELGGNDGLRGYPIARIRSNLATMVTLAQDSGARVLLVGMQIPPNYGARYTEAFHGTFAEIAERDAVALVPFLLDGVATDPALMQGDGIHPTAEAQPALLDNLWPALQTLLPTLHADARGEPVPASAAP
ncbi:MAG: arylesterase [Pseudomonadales bacterium]|nr:arylesterase [Pseudomonadales bacterium]